MLVFRRFFYAPIMCNEDIRKFKSKCRLRTTVTEVKGILENAFVWKIYGSFVRWLRANFVSFFKGHFNQSVKRSYIFSFFFLRVPHNSIFCRRHDVHTQMYVCVGVTV